MQNEVEYQRAYWYAKFRRVSNYFTVKRNQCQVDIYKRCQLDVIETQRSRKKQTKQASKINRQ